VRSGDIGLPVLRSKLLYGLESAQLIPSVSKKLEIFQLKVLRTILRMDTTYVNRANTNDKVYKKANDALKEDGKNKEIIPYEEVYKTLKKNRACKIIREPESIHHKITFKDRTYQKWIHRNRRVGQPRKNWTEETIKDIWLDIKAKHTSFRYTEFDPKNENKVKAVKEHAKNL